MHIDRRTFLQSSIVMVGAGLPHIASAQPAFSPKPGAWRRFQVATRVEISQAKGPTQAWIPLPSITEDAWFKSSASQWTTNGKAAIKRDPTYGSEMLHIEWVAPETTPVAEVTSAIATRDRSIDLSSPGRNATQLTAAERAFNTAGSALIPVDGIVKQTSDEITSGASTELERVRAIYEWIVAHTYRDAKVRGCGMGDIVAMLKSGNLGGKCADLNALFVGLTRAAGIPARDIYGIRVAPSKFGYKSLGANSEIITKAQHCRAEVYLTDYGWVAMDPADVRKVALEEPPGHLSLDNPKVAEARETLFGSWEGNWLAYNVGHDIALPGSQGPKLAFLMYPQAETAGLRPDCLDADAFRYSITAKEITSL